MCFNFIFNRRQSETRVFLPSDQTSEVSNRKTKKDLFHQQSRQNTQKFKQIDKIKKIEKEDFQIIQMIGQGSNAQVFLVTIKNNSFENNVFCMKQVPKSHLDQNSSKTKDNVLNERSIMTQLQHPFLMPIYFSFQSQQHLYLIMEYMIGGDLFFHKNQQVFFSEEKARFYLSEIIVAVGALHSQNIIHRDIKLENVVISDSGHIRLLDYGLAKSNMKINSEAQTICGTPNYLAPEIILQKKYNKSVDWWQIGVMAYEMMANSPPFQDQNRKTLLTNIINCNYQMKPNFSADAQSLISQLLVLDPNKRLGSGVADSNELRKHPFFKSVNWSDVENLNVTPPFVPKPKTKLDTSNFDKDLVSKIYQSSLQNLQEPLVKNQEIQGFSYNYQQLNN